jgi:hypothetical protein
LQTLNDSLGAFDRALTPHEIIDKLEERVGPEGRMRTAPHSRVRTKEEAAHRRPLQRRAGQKSSRPPFTPEPQKRDGQILVANRIAGEAVVRIVPSNSFDRCNYATSASDRRVHEIFNWCPRSNSRTFNSPRPGRVAIPPDTPAALSSSPRLTVHRWSRLGLPRARIDPALDSRRRRFTIPKH